MLVASKMILWVDGLGIKHVINALGIQTRNDSGEAQADEKEDV